MAILLAGFFVLLRPFIEIFPGMIARALSVVDYRFDLGSQPIDNVFPLLIKELIPGGLRGLILVGILASVMSTIAALLNSIATLYTLDVHQKWLRPEADERELVRVGTAATFVLVLFSIFYSPLVGKIGEHLQLLPDRGLLRRADRHGLPVRLLLAAGHRGGFPVHVDHRHPAGFGLAWLLPVALTERGGRGLRFGQPLHCLRLTQVVCACFVIVALHRPEPEAAITSLLWSRDCAFGAPRRTAAAVDPSPIGFWWVVFLLAYLRLLSALVNSAFEGTASL